MATQQHGAIAATDAHTLSADKETFDLAAGHELRVELDHTTQVAVTVHAGDAEVFGTPLGVGGRTLVVGPQKVAVYTMGGARVEVQGSPEVMYVGEETPMRQYINVHDVLQAQRDACGRGEAGADGALVAPPKVMLVGPTDSGKSTICKVLANYAVRCGSSPLFVDLDVGQGSLTVPGCVSACAVEHPVDVEDAVFPGEPPVVFYVGSASPSENADLYRHCVERRAGGVEERERRDAVAGSSGILVNTMGWVEGLGYELLLHAAEVLKVNTVVVIGQDRLHAQLKKRLGSGSGKVAVVKVAKSDGVVLRSKEQRQEARQRRVEEYFYGLRKDLMPVSQTAKFENLEVYRVGGGPKAPRSALPIGATSVSDPLKISKVGDFRDILNCMVAISHASSPEELLNANVAGFIYVQDVDVEKGTVTYLSPRDGALPSTLMLAGTYRTYFD